jgi:hypothetical protein
VEAADADETQVFRLDLGMRREGEGHGSQDGKMATVVKMATVGKMATTVKMAITACSVRNPLQLASKSRGRQVVLRGWTNANERRLRVLFTFIELRKVSNLCTPSMKHSSEI